MEAEKLQQALDEILKKCKDAGHKLRIFKKQDIELESVVGRGEEGIVQLCRIKYHGLEEPAAMKTITTNGGKEMLEFLLKELEMVVLGSDAISNTVLKVYGVTLIPVNSNTRSNNVAHCHLGIIMERGICNLLELCLREQLSLPMRVRVMTQLARGIHYLHSGEPHIVHRDIKPQNFVVVEAEISERTGVLRNVKIKVIDLGMAVMVKSVEEKVTGVVGTWGYHAPEMWEEKPYDAKVDIFSMAVTFLVLLMESPTTKRVDEVLDKLHDLKIKEMLGEKMMAEVREYLTKDVLPSELEDLLNRMLSSEKKRPSNIGTIYKQLCGIVEKQRRSSSSSTISSSSSTSCSSSSSSSSSKSGFASPVMMRKGKPDSGRKGKPDSGRESDSDYSSLHSNSSRGSGRDVDVITETSFSGCFSPGLPLPFPNTPMSPPLFIHPSSSTSQYSTTMHPLHPLSISSPPLSPTTPTTPSTPTTPVAGYVTVEEFNSLAEQLRKQTMTLSFKEHLLQQKEAMLIEHKKTVKKMETDNRMLLKKLSLSKDVPVKDGPIRFGVKRPLFRQPSAPFVRKRTRSSSEEPQYDESLVEVIPATRKRRKTSEEDDKVATTSVKNTTDATAAATTDATTSAKNTTDATAAATTDATTSAKKTTDATATTTTEVDSPEPAADKNPRESRKICFSKSLPAGDTEVGRASTPLALPDRPKRKSDPRKQTEGGSSKVKSISSSSSSKTIIDVLDDSSRDGAGDSASKSTAARSSSPETKRGSETRRQFRACAADGRTEKKNFASLSSLPTSAPPPRLLFAPPSSRERLKRGSDERKADDQPPRRLSAERLSRIKTMMMEKEREKQRQSSTANHAAPAAPSFSSSSSASPPALSRGTSSFSKPAAPAAPSFSSPSSSSAAASSALASPPALSRGTSSFSKPAPVPPSSSSSSSSRRVFSPPPHASTSRVGGDKTADPDDADDTESTVRITTRNQKSFWQEKVTRSRVQENESLKGVWNGFQGLKRLTSLSNWFSK